MKTSEAKRLEFRRNLETGTFMIAPGIYDALSAKVAEVSGLNLKVLQQAHVRLISAE